MSTPDLIPVPQQDPIDLKDDAEIGDVRTALKSLSEKYESLKNILAQNINRLSLSTRGKKNVSTLLKQPATRREDYELKAGLEVGLRTTTTVGAKFCRLAVGPHVIEKPWAATEPGMRHEPARGLRRVLPGTITVNATTVTGVGTQFTRDFFIGDVISVYNGEYPASTNAIVTAIASDTSMTIAVTMTVPTASSYRRNGHDTNPPFSLEATYTNGTTVGLNTLDQPFVDMTGGVCIPTGALTTVKGAIKNYLLQSQDFATTWTTLNITSVANTTDVNDPLGTQTADKVVNNNTNANHALIQAITSGNVNASTVVFSLYVHCGTANIPFICLQVDDGVITNYARQSFNAQTGAKATYAANSTWTQAASQSTAIGNGWYRFELAVNCTTGTNLRGIIFHQKADTLAGLSFTDLYTSYIWGAQMEQNMGATTAGTYNATTTAVIPDTQFTRDYRVGDNIFLSAVGAVASQIGRITAITNDYTMTVHRNMTATNGRATHQKRSWLAVHVVTNETGNKIGMVLSKYSHNPKMPPGFTFSRRVGWVRFLDTTGNTEVFARFLYDGEEDIWWWNENLNTQTQFSVIYGASFTVNVYTSVSASAAMPPTARHSKSSCYIDCQAGAVARVGFKNAQQSAIVDAALTSPAIWGEVSGSNDLALTEDIPVCSCQNFAINTNNAGHVFYLTVWGYQDII